MRPSRWLFALLLTVMPLAGCEEGKNRACEPCSNASDCEPGLTCQVFADANQNDVNLCGDASPNMICPPR